MSSFWILSNCGLPFLVPLAYILLNNMSSSGITNVNNSITGIVASIRSTEKSTLYTPQSEQFSSKQAAKSKFSKNKHSLSREKNKAARRTNKVHIPPKVITKPFVPVTDYVHQSLVDRIFPASLLDQAKSTVLTINPTADLSKILEVFEVIGALAISLPMCKTPAQVASQILLSIRAMTNGSIIETVLRQTSTIEWCKETFGFNMFEPQAGLPESAVAWLKSLPSLKENWDAARNAPIFGKVSNLIAVAASIGLCSITNLNWSIAGVDVFRAGAIKKHQTASDLVGAVLDTIICFIEGGFECFRQGSFKPLLFTSDEGRALDELYFPLIEAHEHAMVFNLHAKPLTIKGETKTISDIEYSQLLDEALDLAERAFKSAKGTWQQGYLEKRREILHRNRASYQAKRIDGSMRFSPFTIYLWGDSGVGKSTVAQVMMADCLAAAGVNPDSKGTAIIKESDKFDSTLKGDTVGIFFDDMGNTKAEFLDKSPTERVIDINNNMITYANKADLHEKGKIEIRPRVFVISSNAPLAVHGRTGSIKPYSIVRRGDLHIHVGVKPCFAKSDGRLDSSLALDAFPGDSLVNDIWSLQLYVPSEDGDSSFLLPEAGGLECEPVSIHDALRVCTQMCQKHFTNQVQIVKKGEGLVLSRKYCSDCLLAHDLCECPGDIVADEAHDLFHECTEEQASITETFAFVSSQFIAMGATTSQRLSLVPEFIFNNRLTRTCYLLFCAREFIRYEKSTRWACFLSCFFISSILKLTSCCVYAILSVLLLHIILYVSLLAKWRDVKLTHLANRRDITGDMFASIRQSKMLQFFSVCVIAKVLYQFTLFFRGAAALQQSALAPSNVEEVKIRDAQVNPWATAVQPTLRVTDRSATMTHEQVCAKITANLFHATFVENDFQQKCDVLALGGNIYLMPLHVFKNRKDMKALFVRADPSLLNSTFKAIVSVNHMIPIEGKDACIVSISSGGVHADIIHLFPTEITASGSSTFLYRNPDGTMRSEDIRIVHTKNSESGGPGYEYVLPFNTFSGLCMGTCVAKFARTCIAGIHLRGVPDSPQGKALTLLQKELLSARKSAFKKWNGAFPSHVYGDFPETRYGQQICTTTVIHPKSPVNFLPLGSSITYLGQAGTRVSMTKSKVCVTPISKAVTDVTGRGVEHGPPQFHRTRMWQASLAHSANPSVGIEGSLVEAAYHDYVDGIKETFLDFDKDWIRKELKPLTDMETLCGVDGKRFVDAIPKNTSKGFPLSGPKSELINLLDPEEYPNFQCPAEVHDEVLAEISQMESCLLKGERCYSIFKACAKDEPTLLGKEKVRIFQASDMATQMIVRKHFLPISRLLSIFPISSETGVGINAQGPEWDQLAKHMRKFGEQRIFAGDYSKYDLRMPAQLVNAAFAVLIDIAQECGDYTNDQITIMRGLATEIAYSCVAYNGDLIIHNGSGPSGHPLTVHINDIVNSLQLRCAYFHLWPLHNKGPPLPFREVVAVITYGDDVKGSVKEGHDWYNHISYANFLKARDMVFTMPDKTSTPTPYMEDKDADFLKRNNVFNEDTGLIHGALDEISIFKSLHTVLESKVVSLEDQSAMNIDGALREWWQHGRTLYETRRGEMKEVAHRCDLTTKCDMLNQTYEDRLTHFKQKYLDEPVIEEEAEDLNFVTTVGNDWE